MTLNELSQAAKEIEQWFEWEKEVLGDLHAYGQRFGSAGENVFKIVLRDALAYQGLTLQQLRRER